MKLLREIEEYTPYNEQEEKDKEAMIDFIKTSHDILLRENKIAHFTASSWLVNKEHTRVLMIYHNIFNAWSWTGGHADGEEDLLSVAIREAGEETGIAHIAPVSEKIFSLEIITVDGHRKRGEYVPSHLHVNLTYLLEADETDMLRIKEDENSGVKWFPLDEAVAASSEPWMRGIYQKLNDKLKIRKAVDYLKAKGHSHIGMLEPVLRNHADILYAEKDGVLLWERKSNSHMLSADNEELAGRLVETVDQAEIFLLQQPFCVEFVKERFGLEKVMDCVQAVYTGKEPPFVNPAFLIRPLEKKEAAFVNEHYHTSGGIRYFEELIEEGLMFGAYAEGSLVGFIGQHAEGSMGLLEVLPEFKRRGIGTALEAFLIQETMKKGNTAFCQIEQGNDASMELQKSLGMEISDQHLYWLF